MKDTPTHACRPITAPVAKKAALLLVFILVGWAGPRAVHAQVGPWVFDPGNYAIERVHNELEKELLRFYRDELDLMILAMRRLEDFNWRDPATYEEALAGFAELGGAFGYGRDDLVAALEASFPGMRPLAEEVVLDLERWAATRRALSEQEFEAVINQFRQLRAHYDQLEAAREELRRFRDALDCADPAEMLDCVVGHQGTLDLLASAGIYEVEEWRLVRQLYASDLVMTTVRGSDVLSEKARRLRLAADVLKPQE